MISNAIHKNCDWQTFLPDVEQPTGNNLIQHDSFINSHRTEIRETSAYVLSCYFYNLTSPQNGAAIFFSAPNKYLMIECSTFFDCHKSNSGDAGAFYVNKGNIVRSINLNGAVPSLLLVTNGWGFIVCYAQKISEGKLKHYVYVFSINGELIRKRKLDFEIAIWSSWTSNKAFDYMVISDDNGKLFAFEVFYCNIGEMIYRCNSRITTLTYLQDIWCISAATKDGRILFVPYEIIE